MFNRPHHQRILTALSALDAQLLATAQCYFAGGTAIAMALDEYRESVDIDFLCASPEGYRQLRQRVFDQQFSGLCSLPLAVLRDVRADQYGIRTFVEVEGVPIKFEIIRESRIALCGGQNANFPVPLLSRDDLFAEKLLANADRYHDRATMNRDVVDLAMMIHHWGDIPALSLQKARQAYGGIIDAAWDRACTLLRDQERMIAVFGELKMDASLIEIVQKILSKPLPA